MPGYRPTASRVTGSRPRQPVGHFPTTVSLADEFAFAGDDERFEMLIGIFIEGLARRAAR
jgi:hypothetical protein